MYSITAPTEAAADFILENGPWSVHGKTMTINRWPMMSRLEDLPLHLLPIWIQIHGLQRGNMTADMAQLIGLNLGRIIEVDPEEAPDGTSTIIRCRVEVDARTPVPPVFWFNLTPNSTTYAKLFYERLSNFCYNCGRLGHNSGRCEFPRHPDADKMGPHMSIQPPKRFNPTPQHQWNRIICSPLDSPRAECRQTRQYPPAAARSRPSFLKALPAIHLPFVPVTMEGSSQTCD